MPKPLLPGGSIGLFAPSGVVNLPRMKAAVDALTEHGYRVVVAPEVEKQWRYFAGTDDERLASFHAMLADSTLDGMMMVRGGYAYLNSKIIDDTNVARIGLRKPNAPEHQFNLYAAYTFEAGVLENLRLSAGVVYSGSTFAAITNTIKRPEYTIANLNASYKVGRYRFDAIASNVFDETYFLSRNNAQVNAGEPRQLLFRVSTRL